MYQMSGGKITGCNKKYGGAIYISSGATFTMTGGTIENCSAEYGGAIYIEAGGTCNLTSGTIQSNTATKNGVDIYIEVGGNLTISESFNISRNTGGPIDLISGDTLRVGHLTEGIDMHYLEFGTYPQTFVGSVLNGQLESWFNSQRPSSIKFYEVRDTEDYDGRGDYWNCYLYTDGNLYARGESFFRFYEDRISLSGENIPLWNIDGSSWFKVEPIKWIILNYDEVIAGTAEEIDCLSYMGLAGRVPFHLDETEEYCNRWINSWLRYLLNNNFYNNAFSSDEKNILKLKTVKNNYTGTHEQDNDGYTTQDYVWCLSYYELMNTYLTSAKQRLCSPTDFAISTEAYLNKNHYNYQTAVYPDGKTCEWWTRSAGTDEGSAFHVSVSSPYICYVESPYTVIRPAISIAIA